MTSRNDLYSNIICQFRQLQKRNRAVAVVGSIRISLVESHLLTEIDSAHAISGKDLALKMHLPKQEISRLGSRLIQQGLVCQVHGKDARVKLYSLTKSGKALVQSIDDSANPLLEKLLAPLSSLQRKHFERCMRTISDAAQIVPLSARPSEPPVRAEIRRLTRAFTLLKSRVFDSPLHPTEWHILSEIQEHKSPISVSTIALELNLSLATVSASLKNLLSRKLVSARFSRTDARNKLFALTAAGLKTLQRTIEEGAAIIARGMDQLPASDSRTLTQCLNKILSSVTSL